MKYLFTVMLFVLALTVATPLAAHASEGTFVSGPSVHCNIEVCGLSGRLGGCDPVGQQFMPWDQDYAIVAWVEIGNLSTNRWWETRTMTFSEWDKDGSHYEMTKSTPTGLSITDAYKQAIDWCNTKDSAWSLLGLLALTLRKRMPIQLRWCRSVLYVRIFGLRYRWTRAGDCLSWYWDKWEYDLSMHGWTVRFTREWSSNITIEIERWQGWHFIEYECYDNLCYDDADYDYDWAQRQVEHAAMEQFCYTRGDYEPDIIASNHMLPPEIDAYWNDRPSWYQARVFETAMTQFFAQETRKEGPFAHDNVVVVDGICY